MSSRQGIVIKKEFNKLGTVNGVNVDVLTVSDINSNKETSLKGVKFSTYQSIGSGLSSSSYERSSYIDAEEIDGVITFLEFVRQLSSTPSIYTEYVYTTKGDFKAVVYTETNWSNKLSGNWILVVYGDKYYSGSAEKIQKKNIEEFYNIVVKAKELVK